MICPTPISMYIPMMRGEIFSETLNIIIGLDSSISQDLFMELVKTMSIYDNYTIAHNYYLSLIKAFGLNEEIAELILLLAQLPIKSFTTEIQKVSFTMTLSKISFTTNILNN